MIYKNMYLFSLSLALLFGFSNIAFARQLSSMRETHSAPENFPDSNWTSHLQNSWKFYQKNKNIVVAVIDSGIQFDHPYLKNNIYVPKSNVCDENFGVDFSKEEKTNYPFDSHGHGTHVAGIIKSTFPEVKILALKYLNKNTDGHQNLKATIKALKYAVEQNVDIINYSSGGPYASQEELEVLTLAEKKGILVITAAGNEHSNIDLPEYAYYPGSYGLSNIITVAAHDENNNLLATSNWGIKSVDIVAPGIRIMSALPGGRMGLMSGTSQATAFVTGVVARLKSQFPNLSHHQIRNFILNSSTKIPSLKNKVSSGGKLDAFRAVQMAMVDQNEFFDGSRKLAKAP